MQNPLVAFLALACAIGTVQADTKTKPPAKKKVVPGKEFWKILVKPGAKWVLRDSDDKSGKEQIVVETYDQRKVGDADVARIRWTHIKPDGTKEDIGATESGKPTQVAVTAKGLFLLNKENDDTKVAERLKGKPSRSSPPKSYKGTKTNQGRYLTINDEGIVCMGEAPTDENFQCEDVCDAWICISPTDGVTELAHNWAPGQRQFER